jgi:hypothetical protein
MPTIATRRNKKAALKRAAVNKERDLLKSLAIEKVCFRTIITVMG